MNVWSRLTDRILGARHALRDGLRSLWRSFGEQKDRLTVLLTLVGLPFIAFQYFQTKLEARVERSLSFVSRQHDVSIAEARIFMDYFALRDDIRPVYEAHPYFDDELLDAVWAVITKDKSFMKEYTRHFFTLYTLYTDVSLCTIHGVCDKFTSCRAFFGRVQFFRYNNKRLFDTLISILHEDKTAVIDRFLAICDDKDVVFALVDHTWSCRSWAYVRALLRIDFMTACEKALPPNPEKETDP